MWTRSSPPCRRWCAGRRPALSAFTPRSHRALSFVMPGLDPGIQEPRARSLPPWIAGSSPAMTACVIPSCIHHLLPRTAVRDPRRAWRSSKASGDLWICFAPLKGAGDARASISKLRSRRPHVPTRGVCRLSGPHFTGSGLGAPHARSLRRASRRRRPTGPVRLSPHWQSTRGALSGRPGRNAGRANLQAPGDSQPQGTLFEATRADHRSVVAGAAPLATRARPVPQPTPPLGRG